MILADETEADTAATQPREGLARRAHRDDERRRELPAPVNSTRDN